VVSDEDKIPADLSGRSEMPEYKGELEDA